MGKGSMKRLNRFIVVVSCFAALYIHAWEGPRSGPPAQKNKKIIFIASDLNNGGVIGVKNGFLEAVRVLGWEVVIKDGGGNFREMQNILRESLRSKVDGIVLGGFQPDEESEALVSAKLPVLVGWHAGPGPKRSKTLFANVTTEAAEVAKIAALSLQKFGSKTPGVVIITDNQFAIANEKVYQITETLKKCKPCKILVVENVPITRAQSDIPSLVVRLNQQFGKKWTHTIAINDIYFDNMNFPLKEIGRTDIANIAAGDGSSVAISRIKGGASQQAMTVAEPLLAQGWQVADELNRAFAGKKESGFVTQPIPITKEILDKSPGDDISSHLSFRETYTNIWKRR